MSKFTKIFKSRTVWTIILIFLINGTEGIKYYIPEEWINLINAILAILAVYFRIDQKQNFKE